MAYLRITGDLCGSVYLDERFKTYIRSLLGDHVVDGMRINAKEEMMRTWVEKVKFSFGHEEDGYADDYYEVTVGGVPDNEKKSIEGGFHTIETFVNPVPNL